MAIDDIKYYEWEGLAEIWKSKDEVLFDKDFPSKKQEEGDTLAKFILKDIFDLEYAGGTDSSLGSSLPGYDVIARDAYDIVNLSLAVELANNTLYECYADENGKVKYHQIGGPSFSTSDILYTVNGAVVESQCDIVMVQGYDPPPKRYTRERSGYNLLNWANSLNASYRSSIMTISNDLLPTSNSTYTAPPTINYGNFPHYIVLGELLGPEACKSYKEGYIEYGEDPDVLSRYSQKALIEYSPSIYNDKEFESVLTYLYSIELPTSFDPSTTELSFSNRTPKFIQLSGFGKLQTKNYIVDNTYKFQQCLDEFRTAPAADVGIQLPGSDDSRFISIADVWIWGYRLNNLRPNETLQGDKIVRTKSPAFRAHADTMKCESFKLTREEDYIIVKDTDGVHSKIVFACNVRSDWLDRFGNDTLSYRTLSFSVWPSSIVSKNPNSQDGLVCSLDPTVECTGYLKDRLGPEISSNTVFNEAVFPTGEGGDGYVVKRLFVVYEWDSPCIAIKDLDNKITLNFLKDIKIKFYPMLVKDVPAPIAVNGNLLDPTEILPDYDPTTVQNFPESDYMLAFSSMEGGDLRFTFPFADPEQCKDISRNIKSMVDSGKSSIGGKIQEVVHICKPSASPVLGAINNDGLVVNSIDYAYQDSSQYFINVNMGPKWRTSGSWDQAIYQMSTERFQAEGVVQKVSSDNTTIRVNIDRFGVMDCVNGTKNKIEAGDRVSVTINNNPVSK